MDKFASIDCQNLRINYMKNLPYIMISIIGKVIHRFMQKSIENAQNPIVLNFIKYLEV